MTEHDIYAHCLSPTTAQFYVLPLAQNHGNCWSDTTVFHSLQCKLPFNICDETV